MQLTAEQAGAQIVNIYQKAIKQTTELVKNQPDAEIIQTQFDDLLHSWQTELLTIGQHVMGMTEREKQQVGSAVNKEHVNMQYDKQAKQQFTAYSQGIFPYHQTNPELYQKLKSINIITQFAFFDLLKKQNPGAEEKWGDLMTPYVCSN
ncbi:MAG: hypothetical protein KDI92_05525 [Xanthomonadales bacterium]|nr:hypothetical protein [Xanthomonadales bacterium]